MNVTVPDVYAVPLGRGGKFGSLEVSAARMPQNAVDHIWQYGVRQILNDAIAQKTDENGVERDLVALATKRLESLYSGELRQRGESEPADPVEAEAYRIAWKKIGEFIKTTPEWPKTKGERDRVLATINLRSKTGEKTRDEIIARVLDEKPSYREAAERIVRERERTGGDLGIEL